MRVIWPFVAILVVMLLMGHASLELLSGVRALANAESGRAKAVTRAAGNLEQYAQTRSENTYSRFLAEMAVISALSDARGELAKPRPDVGVAKRRLRDAGLAIDDVESMTGFYRRFGSTGFVATIVALSSPN